MSFRSVPRRLLQLAAGGCVVMAVLWALGPCGAGEIDLGDVPGSERLTSAPAFSAWAAVPTVDAYPTKGSGWHVFTTGDAVDGSAGHAEPSLVTRVDLYESEPLLRRLYLAINVGLWIVLAIVAWLLAGVARSGRSASPFTLSNARRLSMIGVIVLIGSAVHSIGDHLVLKAMLDSSNLGNSFAALPYDIDSPPWAAIAAGVGTLAIAQVWRRGVQLEADLEDLV